MKRSFVILASLFALTVYGQGRNQLSINDGWRFYPDGAAYAETIAFDDKAWEQLSLPHTWNTQDVFDNDLTYRRGIGWYRKELLLDSVNRNKNCYLYFEGVAQQAYVYVNGFFAGEHKGGYTGFAIDVTPYLNWKAGAKNVVAVQVNNAHDPFIPPLNVGYASYGGIYRDTWMMTTGKLHFAAVDNNSGGVYITTPAVTKEAATIAITSRIKNDYPTAKTFRFVNTVVDGAGKPVQNFSASYPVAAGEELPVRLSSNTIANPRLWSPESPYLYTVRSQVVVDETVVDEVENKIGFRWFSFSPDDGFQLNGTKYILHGTNRHQDMKGKGDALTPEDHRRDLLLIKNMGANFMRLAHYPQAADVLKLADELGLLIWEEIPVVNFITTHPAFTANAQQMLREMIMQGFNHPSVILWGSTNEVFLHGKEGERIPRQTDSVYAKAVKQFVVTLDGTVRAEDPTRYSTMAMHASADYTKYGLDTVAQVAGYNIYSGWYSGKTEDLSNDLDRRKSPRQAIILSEYGAEGEVRLNTEKPVRFDYTGQYQRLFHEAYLRQIRARPWLGGTAIWNEFDFSQPNIGGPAKHMNQKGLITWERKPKDAYYLYKAAWNPEPMVYIASRDWPVRGGERKQQSTIDVYSNGGEVALMVNGQKQGTRKTNDVGKASWLVQLKDGRNEITATTTINRKTYTDNLLIEYQAYSAGLQDMKTLFINTGSAAQYLDPSGNAWIEDRPYENRSFGAVGGTAKAFDRKDPVMHTDDEPLFFSYMDSIQAYRFDAPDGLYRVTLCFAEPLRLKAGDRVFDVLANDERVIAGLDLAATFGFAQAVKKTFLAEAKGGNGINIRFEAKRGGALLNGIKLERY